MPVQDRDPRHPSEGDQKRYRKLLWGIGRNREKQITLAKLTINTINEAIELAEGEQAQRVEQGEKPLKNTEEEIRRLKHERECLEQSIEAFTSCGKQWPEVSPRLGAGLPPPSAEPRSQPLVLVIDDERITAKSLEHFLGQKGIEVVTCLKAEEGLSKAFALVPDLILLDILMPGMNGYQLLARLKQSEVTERIPVIILSSLSRESDILEGLEKGASDFIVKPYSPQILLSKVAKHLSST